MICPTDREEELLASLNQSPTCPINEFLIIIAVIYSLIHGKQFDLYGLIITGPTGSEKLPFCELNTEEGYQVHKGNMNDPTMTFERTMLVHQEPNIPSRWKGIGRGLYYLN